METHTDSQGGRTVFDRVIDHAVEIFHHNAETEAGDVMDGSYAWGRAVREVIQTEGDAIGLALDIRDLPQLKGRPFIWECDGADNLFEFLRSAFYGMGHVFEPAIVAKVGATEYNAIIDRRKALANA